MRLLQCTKRCPRRNEAFFTIFKDKLLIRVEQKDTKGNKSISAKYIYVDENGTPILTKDLDKYDTSNAKYLKKKVLPEVKIEETKTRTFPEWFNDEIMLNKDNIRVKNYRKAEARNPNFSQNWDMATNIYDFANAASLGLVNRFSPTQNIGFAIDAAQGDNLWDSWLGNSGIVSDKFMQEHPYWSMAINGVGDAGMYLASSKFKVPKRFSETKSQPFKSELNWDYEDWFRKRRGAKWDEEDIKSLQSHIPEYLEIEKIAKENGTWLKMPDGSTWKGDPRSWVQLQSKAAKENLPKDIYWHGDDDIFIDNNGNNITDIVNSKRVIWGSSNPHVGRSYTTSENKLIPFVVQKGKKPSATIDAEGRLYRYAYKKNGEYFKTDDFVWDNLKDGEYVKIKNVLDKGITSEMNPKSPLYISEKDAYINGKFNYPAFLKKHYIGDDIVLGNNTRRKFLVGNNGDFDWNKLNGYKSLIPLTILGYEMGKE